MAIGNRKFLGCIRSDDHVLGKRSKKKQSLKYLKIFGSIWNCRQYRRLFRSNIRKDRILWYSTRICQRFGSIYIASAVDLDVELRNMKVKGVESPFHTKSEVHNPWHDETLNLIIDSFRNIWVQRRSVLPKLSSHFLHTPSKVSHKVARSDWDLKSTEMPPIEGSKIALHWVHQFLVNGMNNRIGFHEGRSGISRKRKGPRKGGFCFAFFR